MISNPEDSQDESLEKLFQKLSEVEAEIEGRRVPRCVMILDIAGYTAYVDRHGDVAGRRLIRLAEDEIGPIVQAHGGRILKGLGDGWLISFFDPNQGIQASIEIQRALSTPVRTEGADLKIALDYGRLIDEKDDVFGNVVNTCSRLVDLCEGRQILVSESVYDSIDPFYRILCSPYEERKIRGKADATRTYSVQWRGEKIESGSGEQWNSKILEIRWNGDHGQISYRDSLQQSKPLTSYVEYTLDLPAIEERAAQLHELIGKNAPAAEREETQETLRAQGESLFELLFPESIAQAIRQTRTEFLVLSLDDSCVHIPWELAHDGTDFLCCRFSVGRMARTSQTAGLGSRPHPVERFRMLVLSNPSEDLPAATEEGRFLYDLCRHDSRVEFEWLNGAVIDSEVRERLSDFDVVHYCGHAEFSPDKPDESGWVLGNGRLSAGDLESLASQSDQAPLLVFNNACHSGTTGSWKAVATGWSHGLANAFLLAGCHHYIGAHSELIDLSSNEFAKTFYRLIIAGHPIGTALRKARLEVRDRSDSGSLTWAQYIHYGSPYDAMFRFKVESEPQASVSDASNEWRDSVPSEEREAVGAGAAAAGALPDLARGHTHSDSPPPAGTPGGQDTIWRPNRILAGFLLLACVILLLVYLAPAPKPPSLDLRSIYYPSRNGKARDVMTLLSESGVGLGGAEAEAYVDLFALDAGDADRARGAAEARLAGHPGDPLSLLILARVDWKRGATGEARASLEKLLADPDAEDWLKAEAWRLQGRMALEGGDLDEALACYEKAVALEEEDALLYIDRGVLYEQAGNLQAALAAYGKARELDPEDPSVSELYQRTRQKLEGERDEKEWQDIRDSLDRIKQLLVERGPQEERDSWTSRPLTVALESFETIGQPSERLDEERILRRRLRDALIATEPLILVPPAAETEAVLREYELAGSALADPDLNIELGQMMRPRFSINAAVLRFEDGAEIALETRDNEPGAIAANPAVDTTGEIAEVIPAVTEKLRDALREKYPLRGRIVSASGGVTINIGRLHGVKVGDVFEVYPEQGVDTMPPAHSLGQVRVVNLSESTAAIDTQDSPKDYLLKLRVELRKDSYNNKGSGG